MAATTYATVADLKARLTPGRPSPATVADAYLQDLLNTAAETLDGLTRGWRPGYEAFSESASETRTFDDPRDGCLWIDDAQTVTAVAYNGAALPAGTWLPQYRTATHQQYNRLPTTALLIRNDSGALWGPGSYLPGYPLYGYGYATAQRGIALWTVTGTWGYCSAATRPALIKSLTCALAKWAYELDGVTPQQVMQAIRDPNNGFGREVLSRLKAADLIRQAPAMVILSE